MCRYEGTALMSEKANGKRSFKQRRVMMSKRIYTRCLRGIGIERIRRDDTDAGCLPGIVWWGGGGVVMGVFMSVGM